MELETILEPSLPEIHGDEDQVRHALLSVLIHSVETLGSQGGAITLRTFHSGQQVFLQVEDQGQGLPKPVLDHLFDPQAMPGRGYGLAVVRNIAQEHGGGITVESQSGTGTTYKINFPATPDQRESSEAGLSDLSGDSRLILVVDDDASIRSVLRHGLEGEGYRVLEAEDGVVGFGAFLRHRKAISLVLLDLTMPRMGGQEVLEKMHRLSPGTPVVLMSGYSREEATAAFEGKGLAGFLPKPCKLREALNVVQEVLSHQEEGALKCD